MQERRARLLKEQESFKLRSPHWLARSARVVNVVECPTFVLSDVSVYSNVRYSPYGPNAKVLETPSIVTTLRTLFFIVQPVQTQSSHARDSYCYGSTSRRYLCRCDRVIVHSNVDSPTLLTNHCTYHTKVQLLSIGFAIKFTSQGNTEPIKWHQYPWAHSEELFLLLW